MFNTGVILVVDVYPVPSNPEAFTKPLNLYLNLIYDMSSPLCRGLWSYIMLLCHKERPDWRHNARSMFIIILLLINFPLRSKVAVRNSLCMRDFPLPVDSLNAPSITNPGQDEWNNTAIHFSHRSLQEVCQSIYWTESDGGHCGSVKAGLCFVCVCESEWK